MTVTRCRAPSLVDGSLSGHLDEFRVMGLALWTAYSVLSPLPMKTRVAVTAGVDLTALRVWNRHFTPPCPSNSQRAGACHDGTSHNTDSRLTGLDTIDLGIVPNATYHEARAVNDAGDVAGLALFAPTNQTTTVTTTAALWRPDAVDLNEAGDIVGRSGTKAIRWKIARALAPNVFGR